MYYYFYLLSSKEILQTLGTGTTFAELGRHELASFKLTTPPYEEQKAIASFLDKETSRIDTIIDKIGVQITKLQELRQTLISNTVTGKIDVREEAAV